jgi:uncharacterized protein (DUF342 family)
MVFEDREAVMDWMDANQLGRRNLQPQQASVLRGRIYNRRKKAKESNLKQNAPKDQNDPSVKTDSTAEAVAKKTGVSPATIKRDGKLAEEVEKDPELLAALNDRTEFKKIRRAKKEKNRESRRQENRAKVAKVEKPAEKPSRGRRAFDT